VQIRFTVPVKPSTGAIWIVPVAAPPGDEMESPEELDAKVIYSPPPVRETV
jgi:hypothetical protein